VKVGAQCASTTRKSHFFSTDRFREYLYLKSQAERLCSETKSDDHLTAIFPQQTEGSEIKRRKKTHIRT